uniref:Uncharacterized protein n=1 Tax=Setaria viridis TaxID=4556 RepID=A0A4U6U016_SETVI|nr:hypothetical protein SEVIR_7G309800v2 [Setaria viridis]
MVSCWCRQLWTVGAPGALCQRERALFRGGKEGEGDKVEARACYHDPKVVSNSAQSRDSTALPVRPALHDRKRLRKSRKRAWEN